ncbi:MAG: hypothetical protein NTY19_02980 [Planctomycetota bacterium]|nr:hypothetical protein [Planctomycetota bacterium]
MQARPGLVERLTPLADRDCLRLQQQQSAGVPAPRSTVEAPLQHPAPEHRPGSQRHLASEPRGRINAATSSKIVVLERQWPSIMRYRVCVGDRSIIGDLSTAKEDR